MDLPRDAWRLRIRTLEALVLICVARGLIGLAPFGWWRGLLGSGGAPGTDAADAARARRLAAHVRRAATRLPCVVKCLPQAMALGWMLGRRRIPHAVILAVRPQRARRDGDDLHAWVEAGGVTVLGELPGPWLVIKTDAG